MADGLALALPFDLPGLPFRKIPAGVLGRFWHTCIRSLLIVLLRTITFPTQWQNIFSIWKSSGQVQAITGVNVYGVHDRLTSMT